MIYFVDQDKLKKAEVVPKDGKEREFFYLREKVYPLGENLRLDDFDPEYFLLVYKGSRKSYDWFDIYNYGYNFRSNSETGLTLSCSYRGKNGDEEFIVQSRFPVLADVFKNGKMVSMKDWFPGIDDNKKVKLLEACMDVSSDVNREILLKHCFKDFSEFYYRLCPISNFKVVDCDELIYVDNDNKIIKTAEENTKILKALKKVNN